MLSFQKGFLKKENKKIPETSFIFFLFLKSSTKLTFTKQLRNIYICFLFLQQQTTNALKHLYYSIVL